MVTSAGAKALTTIAVLLKDKDSNVRMVAAQALGQSKALTVVRYLVAVVDDPDEVVACAAIAALEEVQAKGESRALVKCLSDKRWRVRI